MPNHDTVAYCGLCCEDCFIREAELADLAQRLLAKARSVRLAERAEGFAGLGGELAALSDFGKCETVLAALSGLRCANNCRQGGGTTGCAIRACCLEHGYAGCWECEEFENCRTMKFLEPVNFDAHLKNLRLIRDRGLEAFLSGARFW